MKNISYGNEQVLLEKIKAREKAFNPSPILHENYKTQRLRKLTKLSAVDVKRLESGMKSSRTQGPVDIPVAMLVGNPHAQNEKEEEQKIIQKRVLDNMKEKLQHNCLFGEEGAKAGIEEQKPRGSSPPRCKKPNAVHYQYVKEREPVSIEFLKELQSPQRQRRQPVQQLPQLHRPVK